MTAKPPSSSDHRKTERIPFETNVHIEFEKFSGFISEYSTNISEGGIFIRSDQPAPIGTVLSFEFKLKDNFTLIQGLGEVAWIRNGNPPDQPKGMGIRFRELSPQSRQLIATMIANHQSKGGKVFDLGDPDGSHTLPFFDTGETQIDLPHGEDHGAVPDATNLEALFDVPVDGDAPSAPSPSESTRKDLESLFALDPDPKGGLISQIGKRADPERREPTRPEMALKLKPSDRPKWVFVLFGFAVTAGAGAYFFRAPLLQALGALNLPLVSAWLPRSTPPAETLPERPAATPTAAPHAPVTSKAVETITDSTPLDAVAEASPAAAATPTPSASANSVAASPAPALTPTTIPAPAAEAKAPAIPAFGKIVDVKWQAAGTGLALTIEADGAVPADRYAYVSLTEGAPREVIKLIGVREKFRRTAIAVGTAGVARIRVGHHDGERGREVHLVVDLKDANFRIQKAEAIGKTVVFTFDAKPAN